VNPATAFGVTFSDELIRCGLREVVLAPGSRSTPQRLACQTSRALRSIAVNQPYLQQTVSMHIEKPRSRISASFCSV